MLTASSRVTQTALVLLVAMLATAFAGHLKTEAAVAGTIVGPGGPSGEYSLGGSNCSGNRLDPIGVLFRGTKAGPGNVAEAIGDEMGWHWTENLGTQGLYVRQPDGSYACQGTAASRAEQSAVGPNSRYHVRLWRVPAAGGGETKTVGTPHHETWRWSTDYPDCDSSPFGTHAVDAGGIHQNGRVSGFTDARRRMRDNFDNRHAVVSENWGNTEEFHQCDNGMAGSDGYGVTIWINTAHHATTRDAVDILPSTCCFWQGSATLKGHLFTEEASTEYWFAYGTSPSQGGGYPYKTAVQTVSGAAELDPSAAISGLTPNTAYYARFFSRNPAGEIDEGAEVRFIFSPAPIAPEDDNFPGPHVVGGANGAVDAFFRTPSGTLGHAWTQGGSWSEQEVSGTAMSPNSVPHPVLQPNGTVDVFWRTPAGGLGHAWDNAGGWHAEVLPGALSSEPHAAVQPNGTIDVVYRTPSGGLGHNWYQQGGAWQVNVVAGDVASDPYLVAQPNGTVDAFFRTPYGTLGHAWTQGGSWSYDVQPAAIAVDAAPHPVVQNNGTIDVFWRTATGGNGHAWNNAGGWHTEQLPGWIVSEPHAVAQPGGTIDLFWRNGWGELGHLWYQPGTQWLGNMMTGGVMGEPYAVSQIYGTVVVFWQSFSGGLGHAWDDAGGWHVTDHGGSPGTIPHAVAQPNGTIDVLYRRPNGQLGHHWYQAGIAWQYNVVPGSLALEPPTAVTGAATSVKQTTAVLSGEVNPNGAATQYFFEYGPTTAYGSKVPATPGPVGSGTASVAISESVEGLAAGTTYYYRIVAVSHEGTSYGGAKSFETESSGVGTPLGALPVTDPFNGTTSTVSDFSVDWSAPGWASGGTPKGSITSSGWRPVSAYPTVNGASYSPVVNDPGSGIAAAVTMAATPGLAGRYFSLWLDQPSPASGARAGYELRVTYMSTNSYELRLAKWVAGSEYVLASKQSLSFANGGAFAIVDVGGSVSAWTNTDGSFQQALAASDAAYSGGNAGVAGAGNLTRLSDFKLGAL